MSRVVILMGSPRKGGNTDLLAQSFADGASKHNIVDIVSVTDYKVDPCIGCNACAKSEGNRCFQKDDMDKVYELLKKADVLVLASPVYFCGISAQLKAIVDRMHTPMRNEFSIKKVALLLGEGGNSSFEPILLQYQDILNHFHLEDMGRVLVTGAREKGEIKGKEALKEAYELGLSIQ